MMNKKRLDDLPNIGPTLLRKLNRIGVHSVNDLKKLGPAKAYAKLCRFEEKRLPVCYYLYSLEGALRGVHWDHLSKERKDKLLRQTKATGAPL